MHDHRFDPGPGEPWLGPFEPRSIGSVARRLSERSSRRPLVVGIDGRSGAGKSTLAARLATTMGATTVVHTDDLAWHADAFGWDAALVEHVLEPFAAGETVLHRPPAWIERGRAGAIEVPSDAETLLVEGAGVVRASLAPLLDVSIWVQSERVAARRACIDRDAASGFDGDRAEAERFWSAWDVEETACFDREQPWSRAQLVLGGTGAGASVDGMVSVATGR